MKICFYLLGLGFIVFLIQNVCSLRATSRTVYHFPEHDDECIDGCDNGSCFTVKRYTRKCSERFKSYTGQRCYSACSWHSDSSSYKCELRTDNTFEECSLAKKRSRIQHLGATVPVVGCISSCDSFSGTSYDWCRTGYERSDWDYCSKKSGYNSWGQKCWAGEYACQSNLRETVCSAAIGDSWKPCGTLKDETVISTIQYVYVGYDLSHVIIEHDARKTINGQIIDKFVVVNITSSGHGGNNYNNDRKKRYLCRGTCESQTLDQTLTNLRDRFEYWRVNNLNNIRRIDPPEFVPYVEDDGSGGTLRNPIRAVYVRDLSPGVFRVEFVEAEIHMNHDNQNNRINFRSADTRHMRQQPGVTGVHEAGHMVASVLGGPPTRYNLVPQHRSVNRNFQRSQQAYNYENDWFSVEQHMPNFFNPGQPGQVGEPGHEGGHIVWRISVEYNLDTDYVPAQFVYLAQFYDRDGQEINDDDWYPLGGAMNNADYQ